MTILLATNNPHKAVEMRSMLAGLDGVTIITPDDLPDPPPPPDEDGATLEQNAYIKARELFEASGIPTIADDTGLEVESLDGAPGVYSARFAGEGASYVDNCNKLLGALQGRETDQRRARFRTVVCYVDELRTLFAEGLVEGEIVAEPLGSGGFGYDPIFRPAGASVTFAAMSPQEKDAISHRGRALAALRETLRPYFADRADNRDV